jgi:CheY-like chemotaxis protein
MQAVPQPQTGSTPQHTSGAEPSVLVVDDDADFGASCAAVLRSGGYNVLLASDHQKALELLEGDRAIDVLLTDLVMPERVNGLALARMARLRRPELGIVYMTAYDIPAAHREAMGTILRKPVGNDMLLDAVGRALKPETLRR